jgi:hypothetical protein
MGDRKARSPFDRHIMEPNLRRVHDLLSVLRRYDDPDGVPTWRSVRTRAHGDPEGLRLRRWEQENALIEQGIGDVPRNVPQTVDILLAHRDGHVVVQDWDQTHMPHAHRPTCGTLSLYPHVLSALFLYAYCDLEAELLVQRTLQGKRSGGFSSGQGKVPHQR